MKTTLLVLTLMIICCNFVLSVPMSQEENLSDEEHRGLRKFNISKILLESGHLILLCFDLDFSVCQDLF